MTWLVVQDHSLLVEAFFMRAPAENAAGTYAFLLGRNARTYGVHFSIDRVGDIFLTGQVPLAAVDAEEVDRLLGCIAHLRGRELRPGDRAGFARRSNASRPGGPSSPPTQARRQAVLIAAVLIAPDDLPGTRWSRADRCDCSGLPLGGHVDGVGQVASRPCRSSRTER